MKALAVALVLVAFALVGCDDGAECADWCADRYNVDGWLDSEDACICDLPCCWECSFSDGACHDICDDDPYCNDHEW